MTERNMHHDVTVRQAEPEDKETGIAAILRACLRNPVAAVEIVCFIGGGYALYYAVEGRIDTVQAKSEQHYEDLKHEFTSGLDKLSVKLDVLTAADSVENKNIDDLFKRGDTRYSALTGKITDHDVQLGKIQTGVEYLVREMQDGRLTSSPHDHRIDTGPNVPGFGR